MPKLYDNYNADWRQKKKILKKINISGKQRSRFFKGKTWEQVVTNILLVALCWPIESLPWSLDDDPDKHLQMSVVSCSLLP